jgi:ABC-type antimicrobial peptide transport system permease subunit
MLKNYLVTAFRNLYKNKLFALINIMGLGIALAISIVAYYNHRFGAEFDMMHSQHKMVYKINSIRDLQGRLQEYGITPIALGPMIAEDISGVEGLIRFTLSGSPVKHGNEVFTRRIAYADPDYFKGFDLPLISGTHESFQGKGNIMISENLASIHFGDTDPVGELITVFDDEGNPFDYIIGAVFKEIAQNNTLQFEALTLFENYIDMFGYDEQDWTFFVSATFLVIPDPGQLEVIDRQIDETIPVQNKGNETFIIKDYKLLPIKEMAKNSREIWANWLFPGLHPAHQLSPTIMAILILLIACFNFTNTAVSSSSKRLKEISIRKVTGSRRAQIIAQFWGENLFICLLALLVAIAFAKVLLQAYNKMWDYMTLTMSFKGDIHFWIFLIVILFLTAIIAGTYPAIYISSFRPMEILRQKVKLGGASLLSKILLALQITISVVALIGGIVFSRNAYYQDTLDMGYDKEMIIVVTLRNQSDYEKYRQSLLNHPKIISSAGSNYHVGWGNYRRGVDYQGIKNEVNVMHFGPGYMETVGLDLLRGRLFEPEFKESDVLNSIIVNEKFVEDFEMDDPIGKQVSINDTIILTVVGVINNFYTNDFWEPLDPTMIRLDDEDWFPIIAVRSQNEDREQVLSYMESEWQKLIPSLPFNGRFQEDTMQEAKYINASIKKIFVFLAFSATILSLIGLYNLISLNIISRTKEIGIRKVLGASILNIALKTNLAFLIILVFATIAGCVGGYYLTGALMSSIWANHLGFELSNYLTAFFGMTLLALLTVSWKIYTAAIANPADSLRYE